MATSTAPKSSTRQRVCLLVSPRSESPDDIWILSDGTKSPDPLRVPFGIKRSTVAAAVWIARRIAEAGGRAQVVVRKRNGQIEWERTYPRSSDPRSRKG